MHLVYIPKYLQATPKTVEQMMLKKASYSNLTVNFRQVLVQKYTIVQEVCTNLITIILAHTVKQCFRQISCW